MDPHTRATLAQVFLLSQEDINSIEPNEKVYGSLKSLVEDCTVKTGQHLLRAAETEAQATDVGLEGDRVQELLDALGLRPSLLTTHGEAALQLLVSVALSLQLRTTSPEAIIAAAAHMDLQERDARLRRMHLQWATKATREAAEQARAAAEKAQALLAEVEEKLGEREELARSERVSMQDYEGKVGHYLREVRRTESGLRELRERPELLQHNLAAKGREVESLTARAREGAAALEQYCGLPASLLGARLRLQELRQQLAATRMKLESDLLPGF